MSAEPNHSDHQGPRASRTELPSVTQSESTDPPNRASRSSKRRRRVRNRGSLTESFGQLVVLSFAVVSLIALLPMFFTHLRNVSSLPHREHFSLVLLGFAACVFRRWDRGRVVPVGCTNFKALDALLLVFGLSVFAVATAIKSPWLGAVSMICIAGVLLRRLPSVGNRGYFGPWACLLLLIPLPLGMDKKLIQSLQVAATGWSSRLLDTMSIRHLVSGNVLELPGHQLFVNEACSGIQSLFVMVTCVALFCAWTRRPTVLTVPLILSGVAMCVVSNVIRITIVVLALTRGIDLSEGWQHQALGISIFALALFLVYCSEGLFLFALAPIINPATGSPDDRAARHWNELTVSIHATLLNIPEEELPVEHRQGFLERIQIPIPFSRCAVIGCTVGFAFLGVAQQVAGTEAEPAMHRLTVIESAMLDRSEALSEESLPETLGSWKRKSFERIDYSSGTLTDSVTWVYESPFYTATLALDYPFFRAHNVTECYHLSGWEVQGRFTTEAGFSKATLHQPFGRMALLYYDVFDSRGNVELETASGRFEERLGLTGGSRRATWQLQLIVETHYGLTKADIQEIDVRFAELRKDLRSYVTGAPTVQGGGAR